MLIIILGKRIKLKMKYFTKISGNYLKVFKLAINKIKHGINDNMNLSLIIIFNSLSRANYLITAEGKIDLVSFSSLIAN